MPVSGVSAVLDLGPPSPELLEYARRHLAECPDTRAEAISRLRDIVYERGECTPHRMDDAFLVRFLRARQFVPERAHRLLVNYYRFKEDHPELHENVYPLNLRFIGDAGVLAVPPYLDQDGRRLMIYRIGCWDPSAYSVDEIFKATVLVLELGLLEQRAQIVGGVAIFDFSGVGLQHAWQVTPAIAYKVVKLMVSCSPMRTHAVHIVNHSWVFDKMYSLFRPYLDASTRARVHFHTSATSLHAHVRPDDLPRRYGGARPDYSYTLWLEQLRVDRDVVREMETLGYKIADGDRPADSGVVVGPTEPAPIPTPPSATSTFSSPYK